MIDINSWTELFLGALRDTFADRVWFAGLQGSYGRGEATDTSDIDVVVILDELSAADIKTYDAMLNTLPHRDLVCGFLSGKRELLNWEPSDLFQFYYDTKPLLGSLDDILPRIDRDAVERAIRMAACNIYHGCVHNMLHEKSEDILRGLYKSASFAVQAIAFRDTGTYISRQGELLRVVPPDGQAIISTYMSLKDGEPVDLDSMSEVLLAWAQAQIDHARP